MRIIDVVQWDPAPGVFAWRFPNSELNTKTQLIVAPGQEAVLFNQGTAIGPFGPGRHVLNTSNYPVLTSLVKIATGGVTPFRAEVWFISKAFKLDIKWGTTGAIQLEDPKYHIMLPVRSFGQYGLVVENSAVFLSKMIGMIPAFVEKCLNDYYRGIIVTRVKDLIAKYLVEKQISILQLSAHLNDLSQAAELEISRELLQYGAKIVHFNINSVTTDEQDPAVKKLREALATKAEMDIIGYNYQQKRSFDTLETAAGNPGNANFMNPGMGMGMGVAMGMPMGNAMAGMMNNINTEALSQCSSCGKSSSASVPFCPFCGQSKNKPAGIVCDKCGRIAPEGNKFCPFCGDEFYCCPACGTDNPKNGSVCRKCGKPLPVPCPNCGTAVSSDMKFCGSCGTVLVKKCAGCGNELPQGVKFCPSCGKSMN